MCTRSRSRGTRGLQSGVEERCTGLAQKLGRRLFFPHQDNGLCMYGPCRPQPAPPSIVIVAPLRLLLCGLCLGVRRVCARVVLNSSSSASHRGAYLGTKTRTTTEERGCPMGRPRPISVDKCREWSPRHPHLCAPHRHVIKDQRNVGARICAMKR